MLAAVHETAVLYEQLAVPDRVLADVAAAGVGQLGGRDHHQALEPRPAHLRLHHVHAWLQHCGPGTPVYVRHARGENPRTLLYWRTVCKPLLA